MRSTPSAPYATTMPPAPARPTIATSDDGLHNQNTPYPALRVANATAGDRDDTDASVRPRWTADVEHWEAEVWGQPPETPTIKSEEPPSTPSMTLPSLAHTDLTIFPNARGPNVDKLQKSTLCVLEGISQADSGSSCLQFITVSIASKCFAVLTDPS